MKTTMEDAKVKIHIKLISNFQEFLAKQYSIEKIIKRQFQIVRMKN
ncbi:hypothetical protein SAMN04487764_2593 [Gillisia sp. Hel1_33_143]|nr:hypothetical protein SAMN04487764_2593 [Gillisia sp. Hel1_33_143]